MSQRCIRSSKITGCLLASERKGVDAKFLLSVYRSALADTSALYCSAPITSGRRFIQWVRHRGHDISDVDDAVVQYAGEHRAIVVAPNLAHAATVVRELRKRSPIPVIDPTGVPHISGWDQAAWLNFWESVIERFAIGVVLVNDWEFSYGCAHEFMFAHATGIPTFAEDGRFLDLAAGRALIEDAVAQISLAGGSVARFEKTLSANPPQQLRAKIEARSLKDLFDRCRQDAQ